MLEEKGKAAPVPVPALELPPPTLSCTLPPPVPAARDRRFFGSNLINALIVLAIFVVLVYGVPFLTDRGGNGVIHWRTDFEIASREAAQTGRPVLTYFTASWCPPCQKMKKVVWTDDRVADLANAQYVPVLIDIDEQPQLAQLYRVSSIPTIMIQRDGKTAYFHSGYQSAETISAALAKEAPQP